MGELLFKKPVRETNEPYVRFVHEWPCAISHCYPAYPVHAHHVKTRGAGGSDMTCIPLCPMHHQMIHTIGIRSFEKKFEIDLEQMITHYNSLFHEKKQGPHHHQVLGRKCRAS